MKPENNKYRAIDRMILREWRNRIVFVSIAAVFVALTYFSIPKQTKEISATTVSVGVAETHVGTRAFWVVRLDNGTLVRAPATNKRAFKKGQRVSVIEISSEIGTKNYRLSKFLDE